jgi:uncharacterized protein (TIGR02271 family)
VAIAGATPDTSDDTTTAVIVEEQVIPLLAEQISVERRRVETARVLATVTTQHHEQIIEEDLEHERVEVERIPIGQTIDVVPPVRQEGDTTIVPVVEEVLVITRRLVLKEEVHLRRVRVKEKHAATVVTRTQDVVVTRSELHPAPPAEPAAADPLLERSNPQGSSP